MSTVIKASNRTRLKLRFCRLCMESSFIWTFIIGLGVSRDQRMPTRLTPCQITKGPAKVSATVCRAGCRGGTISEKALLFSLLSVTRLVESTVMSTGLPAPGKKKACPPFGASPLLFCVAPFTSTTKLPEAAGPLFATKTRTPSGSPETGS